MGAPRAGHILSFFFPHACAGCGAVMGMRAEDPICDECISQITKQPEHSCVRCGLPLPDGGAQCPACRMLKGAAVCERIIPLGVYENRLRTIITAFKYRNRDFLAAPLARLLSTRLLEVFPPGHIDMVVPVPMHGLKRFFRGYDQAAVLADEMAKCLNVPAVPRVLVRSRMTMPQSFLGRSGRQRNMAEAFRIRCAGAVAGKQVVLIDDVCTTGSTVRACAAVLKKAGARRVIAAVLARDPLPRITT